MPFNRPTITGIIDRVFSDLVSRLGISGALLRRSVLGVLAKAVGGASHMLHGHLDWIAKQAIIDTADEWLPRWAAIWGIQRKPAEFATGSVSLDAFQNGVIVPAGSILRRADGIEYVTQADVSSSLGIVSINVICSTAGGVGNADDGTQLTLIRPVAGISSTGTSGVIRNGTDIESDSSLLERLLARIQRPPHGGAAHDYVSWAREVPGVTRAWVYPLMFGGGTVGVSFVRDFDSNIFPGIDEIAAVQAHIDSLKPATATVVVFANEPMLVDSSVRVHPNTQDVQDAVRAELIDFLKREAAPGGTIFLSRIREAISAAEGEFSHDLILPASNVIPVAHALPVFGSVVFV